MTRWEWLLAFACACSYAPSRSGDVGVDPDASNAADGTIANGDCIAFRASSTATAPSGDRVAIPSPTGLQPGDLMIATLLYQADNDELPDQLDAPPAGWTRIRRDAIDVNGSIGQELFWRAVTSAEPAMHTFTTGRSKRFVAAIGVYAGVDLADPIAANVGQTKNSSTSIDAPAVTAEMCGLIVGAFGVRSTTTFAMPGGMTERANLSNGTATISLAVADQTIEGASGTKTATVSSAAVGIGQLVALRPQ